MAHYMANRVQKFWYDEIKKQGSSENAVDTFWLNLLPRYFKIDDNFGIEHEPRLLDEDSKRRADWIIRYVRNGSRRVVLMEDKRKGYETRDAKWKDALEQLTKYLGIVRAEAPKEDKEAVLYLAVNIGTYTRFYEHHPNTPTCINYVGGNGYDGEPLELMADEVTIHNILSEIAEKCKH